MANNQFNGLEKTSNKSISGEKIYREYGGSRYYKEDYLGNKVECNQYGNAEQDYQQDAEGNAGLGAIFVYMFIIGIFIYAMDGLYVVLEYFKTFLYLSIGFTIILPFLDCLRHRNRQFGLIDFVYLICAFCNSVVGALVTFLIMNKFTEKVLNINLDAPIIMMVAIIAGYFIFKFIQRFIWKIGKIKFMKTT